MTRGVIAKAVGLWHFGGMKFLCVIGLLFAGLSLTARAQQGADDRYVSIYGLIEQADNLAQTGDPGEAVAAFDDAQKQLQQFKREFPDWNPNIVSFRLNHIAEQVADLKTRPAYAAALRRSQPPVTNAPAFGLPPVSLALPTDSDNLRAQLAAAQAANDTLQAKLKEALAVQPAAVDPHELEKAQQQIRDLMKQIDLLNASAAAAKVAPQIVTNFSTLYVTNTLAGATVYVTNTLPPETNFANVVLTNYSTIIVTNYTSVTDSNALEMAQLDRAAAVKNFNDEHDRAEKLADELRRLQANPPAAGTGTNADAALAELRAENARLTNELAALRAAPPAAPGNSQLADDLKQSQALVATLQSEARVAALEKSTLQAKLQQFLTNTNTAGLMADYETRLRELAQERDNLIEKLDQANRQKAGGNNAETAAQLAALNDEVTVLRSRLAVDEASPVPFTPEEQALFRTVVTPPTNPEGESRPISEMPAGTAELVASAQQHFIHQEYEAAEGDYLKILDRDQNNGIALANLATIELQQGKLDAAEKHITLALVKSPDDAYNLSTLGYLKFRQDKYDEALKVLSRAAQLDPNNPEIQNYLGVTLSHQGQRKAAETALRRAIQLNPGYAPAHNNLAVIYLSQTPPLAELARWHYQKALDAGQPHNADLEKMLADKGAPLGQ